MAYDSRVYRVLIASPSDVEEERDIAVKVIQEWNDLYSYSRKVTLLPLRWETHTAPEYGTRPQEVINRAIVDECDLLVGVFWTRIGSPTGSADSGTIEEIDRVGRAGKPIMLYFSRVEIDPEKIAVDQIEKLNSFKQLTYPKGLVEHYRKTIEFRDKFSKQLELKVRDLQRSDASGAIPLSLSFLSSSIKDQGTSNLEISTDRWTVESLNEVPEEKREAVQKVLNPAFKERASFPIPMMIENMGASGIRNLFVEMDIGAELSATEISSVSFSTSSISYLNVLKWTNIWGERDVELNIFPQSNRIDLDRFQEEGLQKLDSGWRLTFEWEALQPQRKRLIQPVIYCYAPESTQLTVTAKVYADSFAEPTRLAALINVKVNVHSVPLSEVFPKWKEAIETKSG